MKNRSIVVRGAEVSIAIRHEQDYISLTDMAKHFDGGSALIEQWLKNKDTVLFLGVWEQLNNLVFNSLEFEGIKNEAGRNSFFLSAKKWIAPTGAIGLHAKAGRYGGTYAHRDIAFEFGSWLSPEFKLYLITGRAVESGKHQRRAHPSRTGRARPPNAVERYRHYANALVGRHECSQAAGHSQHP